MPIGFARLVGRWGEMREAQRPWVAAGALYVTRTDATPNYHPTLVTATVELRPPERGFVIDPEQNLPAICVVCSARFG